VDNSAPVSFDREQQIIAMFNDPENQTLTGRMDIRIVSASRERVVGTMPVQGNTQPYGLLHGGASCVLAETLGSLGSALQAGPDRVTVGIEINATHHRAARGGLVTGIATLVHGGRTLSTFDVVITDDAGKRVCTARMSCLHRDAVPGVPGRA
jgi:1,4-dihydroxy-2-naphthoyl-CoA hydrolase